MYTCIQKTQAMYGPINTKCTFSHYSHIRSTKYKSCTSSLLKFQCFRNPTNFCASYVCLVRFLTPGHIYSRHVYIVVHRLTGIIMTVVLGKFVCHYILHTNLAPALFLNSVHSM